MWFCQLELMTAVVGQRGRLARAASRLAAQFIGAFGESKMPDETSGMTREARVLPRDVGLRQHVSFTKID
jgi:hypothetical protein